MNPLEGIAQSVGMLRGWRKAGLLLLAGAAAGLAMPPFDFWPLLFVTFPVLVWSLGQVSRRQAFAQGWVFGLGYFTACFYWIGIAFLVDAATYLWMMPFMVGALAGGMALYWGLAAMTTVMLRQHGLARIISLAVLLAIAEWLRGHLLTGFPWTAPGLAVDGMGGLAQAASLIGMPGLTLLIVLWAALPALAGFRGTRRRDWAAAALFLVLLPGLWLWGNNRLAENTGKTVDAVTLRIVQPNIAQEAKWRREAARENFDKLKRLSTQSTPEHPRGIDDISVVIWPESAVSFFIDESKQGLSELADMLPEQTLLVMGALRRDKPDQGERVYNSVLAFDGGANLVAHYDKWRLVPGGEFLPFEEILKPLGFRKVVTVPESFAAGPGPRNITLPGFPPAAVLICYEAIFPHDLIDAAERPSWIINVTNDAWFGRSSGPYQHLAQARLRAIEQGLPLIRAANTGISAIIDAYGRIETQLPLGAEGVLEGKLPASLPAPFYARAGDFIFTGLMFLLLLAEIVLRQSQRTE
jgi:apolipoprotein N-acyltransferase